MDFALDRFGRAAAGAGITASVRRDPHRKCRHHVQLHALVAEINVLHVAELHRHFLGDFHVAGLHMEGDAERRGREGNAERHAGIEDLDGLVLRMLPVVVVEIGRGELGVLGDVRFRGAGVDGIFLDARPAAQWPGASKPAIATPVTATSDGPRFAASSDSRTGWPAITRPSSATASKVTSCAASTASS